MNWGGNKYGAVRTNYNGNYYASQMEARYAMELDLRVKAKDIKSWTRQPHFDIYVNGKKICGYTPDFKVEHNDGTTEIVEVKGAETRDFILRKKLFEAVVIPENPGMRYTVVKRC